MAEVEVRLMSVCACVPRGVQWAKIANYGIHGNCKWKASFTWCYMYLHGMEVYFH